MTKIRNKIQSKEKTKITYSNEILIFEKEWGLSSFYKLQTYIQSNKNKKLKRNNLFLLY
jgi:hypothetical protein